MHKSLKPIKIYTIQSNFVLDFADHFFYTEFIFYWVTSSSILHNSKFEKTSALKNLGPRKKSIILCSLIISINMCVSVLSLD